MSQNDYIILRDEDGKAYIAHAGLLDNARNTIRGVTNSISTTAQQVANKAKGVGRGVRQNHKYILKVNENGKTRYFYKQEEVKAYYEAKKRGVKNAAEYAQNAVKDKASDVADAAKNVVNKATGATAKQQYEKASKDLQDAKRWEALTKRTHQENLDAFKKNPTEANMNRAKQSGQAVTKAKLNTKEAAFNQAKASPRNPVTNAQTNYDRMKSEFRDKTKQVGNAIDNKTKDLRTAASRVVNDASQSLKERVSDTAEKITGSKAKKDLDDSKRAVRDSTNAAESYAMKNGKRNEDLDADVKSAKRSEDFNQFMYDKSIRGQAEKIASDARDIASSTKSSAQDMIDQARTAVKDKSEDLSAKAKSTVQSARDSVKGMIENARSSSAKAVNEAWDRIPKNSDGTVNPFDKNFQSTYNDWKAKKDKYDSSLAGRAKDAAEKATDSVKDMIDQAKRTAKDAAASAQSTIDNATGNNYRKRAQEANQAAENAINQRSRTNDQLENQRSKYGSKANDSDHIYGDSEGYYYKTKEQRDRAEALISKRDQYDADIVNNNRTSKVNDNMYADSKAGKINDILGRSNASTSERANSKAAEVQNKWARQEAESKLIGGRLDPNVNVSKEYVYSRASNSGMAGQVRQVMQLEEAMRDAERAYDNLGKDSSKPHSSSRAARQKMLQAQDAYEKAYEELIDDINKQYDRDLAAYEKQYGKYTR